MRSPRGKVFLLGGLAAVLVAAGMCVYAMPTAGKLDRALDRIDWPAGTVELNTESHGNVICFDECTSLSRTYRLPGALRETSVKSILERAGYEVFFAEHETYEWNSAYSRQYDISWTLDDEELSVVIGYSTN